MASSIETFQGIQQQLAEGEIESALEQLHKYVSTNAPKNRNEVIGYSGRYRRLRKEERKGIITRETFNIEVNRLSQNILDFLEELAVKFQRQNSSLQYSTEFGIVKEDNLTTDSLTTGFPNFDVFLAHNSKDRPQVETIAGKLKQRGLKPWIDKEQIPPGSWFQEIIQEAIRNVKTAAIFIGPSGLGKWQALELKAFISQCVEAGLPVIPVLLPSVDKIPENLLFLKELNWVSFKSIDDVKALDSLVWGITGEHP